MVLFEEHPSLFISSSRSSFFTPLNRGCFGNRFREDETSFDIPRFMSPRPRGMIVRVRNSFLKEQAIDSLVRLGESSSCLYIYSHGNSIYEYEALRIHLHLGHHFARPLPPDHGYFIRKQEASSFYNCL